MPGRPRPMASTHSPLRYNNIANLIRSQGQKAFRLKGEGFRPGAVFSRRLPPGLVLAGVVSATAGLALLSLRDGLRMSYGRAFIFCCAVSFAAHILPVGRFAPRHSSYTLTVLQIAPVPWWGC